METTFDHNKLIKKIAKERLLPFGIIQEGKSRTFLYDNGWWTIVIEFQSSSYSKGSYLNIGLDFNFYPREYFAFSYGHRESGYIEAIDELQFEKAINNYCDLAIKKVEELKLKFIDIKAAIKTVKNKAKKNDSWNNYELGILYGLDGRLNDAKKLLNKVKNEKCVHDFEFDRQKHVTDILHWIDSRGLFIINIKDTINKARRMKKLEVADLAYIVEDKVNPNNITLLKSFVNKLTKKLQAKEQK